MNKCTSVLVCANHGVQGPQLKGLLTGAAKAASRLPEQTLLSTALGRYRQGRCGKSVTMYTSPLLWPIGRLQPTNDEFDTCFTPKFVLSFGKMTFTFHKMCSTRNQSTTL